MKRFRYGLGIALLAVFTVAACAQEGAKTAPGKLPQTHEYQKTLRTFMASLTEKDFAHGGGAIDEAKPYDQDPEYLYRNYLLTLMQQPLIGSKRATPAISSPPVCYLLATIEQTNAVHLPPVWPEALMSFVQWDFPGSPFRNNRALKLRAFMGAAVQLMMFHNFAELNDSKTPPPIRPDWHGYYPVIWAAPYPGFKDVLPPEVQKAYETGMKMAGERMLNWGIRGESCENDLLAPLGLVYISRALNDPDFTRKVEEFVKPVFTDARYFNKAGYWVEREGLDTGFGGSANLYASWIALMTDWPFAKDALERVYRLRGHLILPEPDGQLTGPSHFNSRLGGPASGDQFAWAGARDAAAAMVTDEAAQFVTLPAPDALKAAPVTRAHMFTEQIKENIRENGHYFTDAELTPSNTMQPWTLRLWMTYNFPISQNPAYEFYRKGSYAHRQELEKNKSPLLKSPFLRGENFIRDFEKAFVVTRQPAFAAILHTGAIGGQSPDDNKAPFAGPMGLGGGQLSAFWTPAAGSVILGARAGMSYDKSFDQVEAWRTWPNHSVCGATADGTFFTSARIQQPDTTVDIQGTKGTVKVAGVVPASVVGQEPAIAGTYNYTRSFTIDDKGVRVETTIRGDGKDQVAELYEVLPVYLRDTDKQAQATPTAIEFQSAGKWVPATAEFTEGVTAVKLARFTGAVQVTFDSPQRVKLSPADWQDVYLSRLACRNVLVDLLGKPGTITDARTVRYEIRPL